MKCKGLPHAQGPAAAFHLYRVIGASSFLVASKSQDLPSCILTLLIGSVPTFR